MGILFFVYYVFQLSFVEQTIEKIYLPSFFYSQMPSEFSDFQYYGKPKLLLINSSTLQISSDNDTKPNGVELNFKLDHSKSYTLLIAGKFLEGTTLLTLKQDNRVLWVPTPNKLSDNLFVINNTDNLQLLFYSDNKFRYQLSHLTVHEIPRLNTDEDLKRKILVDNPGLDKLVKNDKLTAAKVILNWAANNLVYANDSESLHDTTLLSASEIYYQLFNKKLGGVYCGGAADFYTKICHLFNIDAFNVDMGILNTRLTHVTAIVPVFQNGKYDYYLFDPTFNLTVTDKVTHQFIPINAFTNNKIDMKKFAQTHVGDISHRRYLVTQITSDAAVIPKHEFTNYTNQSYTKYIKDNETEFKKYNILPDNYLIMHLLPHLCSIGGGLSPDAEDDFNKLLLKQTNN